MMEPTLPRKLSPFSTSVQGRPLKTSKPSQNIESHMMKKTLKLTHSKLLTPLAAAVLTATTAVAQDINIAFQLTTVAGNGRLNGLQINRLP